jgi:hypothetical protein
LTAAFGLAQLGAMVSAQAQLDAFLARYSPEIAALAGAAIEALHRRIPQATRLVYDNYNALAVGFCPGERASGAILSVVAYPRWVSLFFLQNGPVLPDPAGILKGKGSTVRHVVVADAAELERPPVSELIDEALALARVPLPETGIGPLIIKSVSAEQRPRRPAGS